MSLALLETARARLAEAFLESLGNQLQERFEVGDVFMGDELVTAIDFGSSNTVEGFSADPDPVNSNNSITITDPSVLIDTTSSSVPFVTGSSTKVHDVFKTARTGIEDNSALDVVQIDIGVPHRPYGKHY
jgi:hypothetical protein